MKKINIKIFYILTLFVSVLLFNSCSKDSVVDEQLRLFRPVLSVPLSSVDNKIIVSMSVLKNVDSYRVEISRDNFATAPLKTIVTSNPRTVIFDKLIWDKLYYVRAVALAADPQYNSYVSDLGSIKTNVFPTNLSAISSVDIIDNALNVRWTVTGAPITGVKIFAPADEELLTPLASYTTTSAEQLAGLRVVKKLTAATTYVVAIYSGDTLRGYRTFTTKAALPTTGDIIDLRGDAAFDPATDDGSYLKANLDLAMALPNGATVILDGDQTYISKGYAISNNLTLISGYSLSTGGAQITNSSQFTIASTATTIDHIVFQGIKFTASSGYLFVPQNVSPQIKNFEIRSCTFTGFRGMCRLRSAGAGNIDNFIMDKCIVSGVADYAILRTDSATWTVGNATFTNSTFFRCQRFVSYNTPLTTIKVTIDACTFFESAITGNKLIDVNGTAILGNLTVKNSIFGHGGGAIAGSPGTPPYSYQFLVNAPLISAFANNWDTNDCTYTLGDPSFTRYNGSSLDLFTDPYNMNFKIKDGGFLGKSNSGDPRWRL